MICNNSLTIYHKKINLEKKIEEWERFNYKHVWFFGGEGARINKGYDNANDVEIRIPYYQNKELDINNFSVGDAIVQGTTEKDITKQKELIEDGHKIFNITSIKDNNFGNNPHIHIGGR